MGAILFGLARAVWSYAQVQSRALILTFLALLIAIGLDMLLVRLIGEVTTAGKARRKKMPITREQTPQATLINSATLKNSTFSSRH